MRSGRNVKEKTRSGSVNPGPGVGKITSFVSRQSSSLPSGNVSADREKETGRGNYLSRCVSLDWTRYSEIARAERRRGVTVVVIIKMRHVPPFNAPILRRPVRWRNQDSFFLNRTSSKLHDVSSDVPIGYTLKIFNS